MGVLVSLKLKENVVEVCRLSNMIIVVRSIVDEEMMNIVCTYAPHFGMRESDK